jgi:cbb3-type cytochrome c oxidase subunit III
MKVTAALIRIPAVSAAVVASLGLALAFSGPAAAQEAKQEAKAEAKPAAPKVDMAKGQAISTQVCSACHTNDGSRGAPANPILQGQHPEYIAKQLADFKAGRRNNPVMKGFASALSEEDMKNVAAFYSTKSAKPGFAKNKDLVQLGEKIYRGGIASKGVPACAGCHSPDGAGIPAQFPRLGGQHADYVASQMNNFRAGTRANGPMMMTIAAKMSDQEIKAVSDYVAGLR